MGATPGRPGLVERAQAPDGGEFEIRREVYTSMNRTRLRCVLIRNGRPLEGEYLNAVEARVAAGELVGETAAEQMPRYDRRYTVTVAEAAPQEMDRNALAHLLVGGRDPGRVPLPEREAAMRQLHQLEVHRRLEVTVAGQRIHAAEVDA